MGSVQVHLFLNVGEIGHQVEVLTQIIPTLPWSELGNALQPDQGTHFGYIANENIIGQQGFVQNAHHATFPGIYTIYL